MCVWLSTFPLLSLQPEQKDTIRGFRQGRLNLLISTSVAGEGLDIPECNLVVRYGLLTNEIAQLQASGRARARNSQYSVVAPAHGREVRRECLNEYLGELAGTAMAAVQDMAPREFHSKVRSGQRPSGPPPTGRPALISPLLPSSDNGDSDPIHQKQEGSPGSKGQEAEPARRHQRPALVSKLFRAGGFRQRHQTSRQHSLRQRQPRL